MVEKIKYAGSYKNASTTLGQLVTADHVVSTRDNMMGMDGSQDILVIKDALSGVKLAYPMPDKTADSTADAIKHIKGDRVIERLFSDWSGEIYKALRNLHIVAERSQPGAPQNNAVAERLVRDVLEGTRTVLVRAGLPPRPMLLGIRAQTLLHDGNCVVE